MRRSKLVAAVVATALLLVGGTALAAYDASSDVYVNACTGSGAESPVTSTGLIGSLGSTAFTLQEGAHAIVTGITGAEVDHYYVWVGVCGQAIPVDPLRVTG